MLGAQMSAWTPEDTKVLGGILIGLFLAWQVGRHLTTRKNIKQEVVDLRKERDQGDNIINNLVEAAFDNLNEGAATNRELEASLVCRDRLQAELHMAQESEADVDTQLREKIEYIEELLGRINKLESSIKGWTASRDYNSNGWAKCYEEVKRLRKAAADGDRQISRLKKEVSDAQESQARLQQDLRGETSLRHAKSKTCDILHAQVGKVGLERDGLRGERDRAPEERDRALAQLEGPSPSTSVKSGGCSPFFLSTDPVFPDPTRSPKEMWSTEGDSP